jgi:glycosyltransferase involved in cell wall biosynthesis
VRSLTILHLAANRWWTGSADPTLQLVAGLRARGHRVLLGIAPGDRFEAKAREAGVELVPGLALSTRLTPAVVRDLARLRRLVTALRIDIVHAHHSHDHWLAWALGRRRLDGGRPAVVRTFHTARSVKRGLAAAALYRRTTLAFAVSREIETRCHEAGFAVEQVVWTPGVADLVRFDGRADGALIREELKLGDAPVVACVARLAASRGHEQLLAGFQRLLETLPSARLLLVGKGERRAALEQVVAERGLAERVVFAGYRDRDLPAVLAAADAFALMAAGSDESCRAALEAMAAGRPVVARRVGALPETIVEGETGVLLDDDAPATVAAALASVLGDRTRARAMGAAGRRRAEEIFGPERQVDAVERAYLGLP